MERVSANGNQSPRDLNTLRAACLLAEATHEVGGVRFVILTSLPSQIHTQRAAHLDTRRLIRSRVAAYVEKRVNLFGSGALGEAAEFGHR